MADSATSKSSGGGRAKRATRACNHCRWKRLKCSDQTDNESCMNCQIYGVTCEYSTKWTLPSDKRKDSADSGSGDNRSRKRQKISGDELSNGEDGKKSSKYAPNGSGGISGPTASQPPKPVDVASIVKMDTLTMDSYRDTGDGAMGTGPSQSGLISDKYGREVIHFLTPLMTGIEDETLPNFNEENDLPPQPVTELLVNAYFDHVHPLYPFMDEERFRIDLRRSYATGQFGDPLYRMIVKTVMMVGATAAPDSRHLPPDVEQLLETLHHQIMSKSYLFFVSGKMSSMQGFALVALYNIQRKKMQSAWQWLSWGIRLQKMYTMRRDRTFPFKSTDTAPELEKNLLTWTFFLIESQIALMQFRDDARLEAHQIPKPSEAFKQKHPVFCHRISFAIIGCQLRKNLSAAGGPPADFLGAVERIYSQIAAWKDELPSHFKPESRVYDETTEYKSILLMHMEYHTLLLGMLTALGASARMLKAAPNMSQLKSDLLINQIALRITNARQMLATVDAIAEASHVTPSIGCWLGLIHMLTPFSFIYGHILRKSHLSSARSDLEHLYKAIQNTSRYIVDSPRNNHIKHLISAMYAAASEAIVKAERQMSSAEAEGANATRVVAPNGNHLHSSGGQVPANASTAATGAGHGDYDYSPTLPIDAMQQGGHPYMAAGMHPAMGGHEISEFAAYGMELMGHGIPTAAMPGMNEQDAAAWLAAQNESMLPHLAMMGGEHDEWFWNTNADHVHR